VAGTHGKTTTSAILGHLLAYCDMLSEFNIPSQLDALKQEDVPKIAKLALEEAHMNYPVPKYMNQKTCESLILKMAA
jgi:hypothetical protein